ncbi:MAG: HEPN domain-containing protein [Akkermansiaceae bacterium]
MSFDLISTETVIHGQFWFPDDTEKVYEGFIEIRPGNSSILNLHTYETNGMAELGMRSNHQSHTPVFRNRKLIHGKNKHGKLLTLYNCYANKSGTLHMASVKYKCYLYFEGVSLSMGDLNFNGIKMHFDFQETWVSKSVFSTYHETINDGKDLEKVTIPFSKKKNISIGLERYKKSEIYCGYGVKQTHNSISFIHRSSFNISFKNPTSIKNILGLIHQWEWFLSLLTRKTVRLRTLDLNREEVLIFGSKDILEGIKIWKSRDLNNLPDKEPTQHDFYCTYCDIEAEFPVIFENWLNIQDLWAAVLHRFFATTQPRDIWANEEFLFLAQAIESIHRIRSKVAGNIDFNKAAKEIYLGAAHDLQIEIGDRKLFQKQLHSSRNYYTHYGHPGPSDSEHILCGKDLADLNIKLRWIIESAILEEIGIPEHIASKVWSSQWRGKWVTYED